jgi:hypothetical protein
MRLLASALSTGMSSASVTWPKSPRSETSWAIFVPDGVTRVVEDARSDVLLRSGQLSHRSLEVLLHDALSATEPRKRFGAQHARTPRVLLLPDSLHDELQVRRLDSSPEVGDLDHAEPPDRRLDLPGTDLVENPLDELRLDRHRAACELREALGRPQDRRPCSRAVETVESKGVGEEPRDAPGEAVELRERVLAQRDEDVHAGRSGQHGRQRLRERRRAVVVGVVEEVLLRLIEHEVHVAVGLRLLERRDSRAIRRVPCRRSDGLGECDVRILAPAREHDDERILRQPPQ